MPRLTLLALAAAGLLAAGCNSQGPQIAAHAIGDPQRGAALIQVNGCGSCHDIPHVSGANGRVGPPLTYIGQQTLIAGLLPNTPANMITWLKAPQSVVPGNGMPNMELSDHDARDIAAYLYTLR
jgi:cytochrome c2